MSKCLWRLRLRLDSDSDSGRRVTRIARREVLPVIYPSVIMAGTHCSRRCSSLRTDDFLKHFSCPVCLQLRHSTRVVCYSGHILCEECLGKIRAGAGATLGWCPSCRLPLLPNPVACQPINALADALGIEPDPVPLPTLSNSVSAPAAVPAPATAPPTAQRRTSLRRSVQAQIRKCKKIHKEAPSADLPRTDRLWILHYIKIRRAVMSARTKLRVYHRELQVPYDGDLPHVNIFPLDPTGEMRPESAGLPWVR